jgi:hypothetical protein
MVGIYGNITMKAPVQLIMLIKMLNFKKITKRYFQSHVHCVIITISQGLENTLNIHEQMNG